MFTPQLIVTVLAMSLIAQSTLTYDLQDTIQKLTDENAYLHHRLENLTHALRDLRRLILDHSKDGDFSEAIVEHDSDQLHAWNEWIHNGINAETHHLLQEAFCWTDIHSSASLCISTHLFFLLTCVLLCNFFLLF